MRQVLDELGDVNRHKTWNFVKFVAVENVSIVFRALNDLKHVAEVHPVIVHYRKDDGQPVAAPGHNIRDNSINLACVAYMDYRDGVGKNNVAAKVDNDAHNPFLKCKLASLQLAQCFDSKSQVVDTYEVKEAARLTDKNGDSIDPFQKSSGCISNLVRTDTNIIYCEVCVKRIVSVELVYCLSTRVL